MSKPFALIIEDESLLADLYSKVIRDVGFETETALDGNTALERVKSTTPDIIILDIHLPFVSGLDILTEIRNNDNLTNTKVIIITADRDTGNKLSGQANFILIKPITITQIESLVGRLYKMITSTSY